MTRPWHWLPLSGLLVAAMALAGCGQPRTSTDDDGAPVGMPNGNGASASGAEESWEGFDPPTRERPIATTVGAPEDSLLFGGVDGRQRILVKRPPGFVTYGVCSYGRGAAILTDDRRVTFYDSCANVVGSTLLPGSELLHPKGSILWVNLHVGPRRQAVVVIRHGLPPVLGFGSDSSVNQAPPDERLAPPPSAAYYVAVDEKAVRLEVGQVDHAWFTADGRFAAVVGPIKATTENPHETWRVLWFDQPERPAWEVELRDRPWLYAPHPGWAFSFRVASRWPIHFRPDGQYAALRDDPTVFDKANPGYVQRAGASYESGYLDKAVDDLAEKIRLTADQREPVRTVLSTFIYDRLEAKVREGGYVLPKDFDACVAKLDGYVSEYLTRAQFPAYLTWRQEAANPLGFLMHRPRDPSMPPDIRVRRF